MTKFFRKQNRYCSKARRHRPGFAGWRAGDIALRKHDAVPRLTLSSGVSDPIVNKGFAVNGLPLQ
jgi:hypothetical protein